MNVDIYKTSKKETYLALPAGNPTSSVPADVLNGLGTIQFWKTVELAPNIIALNPEQVTKDFAAKGYSICLAGVRFSEPKVVKIK